MIARALVPKALRNVRLSADLLMPLALRLYPLLLSTLTFGHVQARIAITEANAPFSIFN